MTTIAVHLGLARWPDNDDGARPAGRRLLLVLLAGLLFAILAAVIAVSVQREPIPTAPGVPATVTTIGGQP